MPSSRFWLRASVASLLALGTARPALADDMSDLQGLLSEQVVTSASKQSEGTNAAPALSMSFSASSSVRSP